MTTQYGDLGGVLCPGCGDEVFRVLEGRCMGCHKNGIKQAEVQEQKQVKLKADAQKHGMWTFKKPKKTQKAVG